MELKNPNIELHRNRKKKWM